MTQQIINTGAANDGTGESLRNAFNAVNENFTQIWAYGPVDTQVVISGNRVSTNQTNLDLVLAGNGVGNVAVASTIVPTVDSVYDLGSPNRYFDTTYSRYFYGNGRFLTGISGGSGGGNVTFSTAPPTDPAVGDIWIESDTGVQYLYFNDDTSNQWAEMEAYISFSSGTGGNGNINLTDIQSNVLPSVSNTYQLGTASQQWKTLYISGNTISIANTALAITSGVLSVGGSNVLTEGSPLTFTNLTVSNSATIGNRATIGNIYSDHYYYANGVPFGQGGGNLGNSIITAKENVLSVSVVNENLVLAGNGVGNIQANSSIIPSIDGVYDLGSSGYRFNSVNAQYFYGNGSQLTGITAGANVDFTAVASNIIPTGNSVYSLGNAAHQWNDLYLSNATIYMNGTPIGLTAGNVLTVNGNDVITANANGIVNLGNLTAPGTITANNLSATNNNGTGQNIKVGDDTYLGDINISNTLSIRGQQDGANAYVIFGNASNVKLGRSGTGPLTYEGSFSAAGNVTAGTNFQLPVYANATVRDSSISSPTPGMMVYVTGTGMQVRGATSWNTIAGSGT